MAPGVVYHRMYSAEGETFLEAATQGDVVQVYHLLVNDPSLIHFADAEDRWTALLSATANDQLAMVELLLNMGARVNAADVYGRTPLYWAAMGHNADMVRLLLKHGASHKVVSSEGLSPLMVAACNGFTEGVRALVAHDSGPKHLEMCNKSGSKAVWMALAGHHPEVVRVLVQHGAQMYPDQESSRGRRVFCPAGWREWRDRCLQYLGQVVHSRFRGASPATRAASSSTLQLTSS